MKRNISYKLQVLSPKLKKLIISSAGFTLIELLVVIGILGILASALVATIDPFEQLKKAQDASVKNALVEFTTANVRYYTTHNAMPWVDSANTAVGTCTSLSGTISSQAYALTGVAAMDCLKGIVADGELKAAFTTVTNTLKAIQISTGGKDPSNNVVACFQPQSKSQAKDANCQYDSIGSIDTSRTHDPAVTTNLCFWCAL